MDKIVRNHISVKSMRRKHLQDVFVKNLFKMMALLSSSVIILIILFILMKGSAPFIPNYKYGTISLPNFLFGTVWRQDAGIYGVGFIVINTLLSAFGALLLSFPISVLTALFIVKVAPRQVAAVMRTIVELLASIPSVVYGVFAAGTIVAFVRIIGSALGIVTAGGNSMMAVIMLLAIMIFPTITSLSISAIEAVDPDLELASLALGATETQTHFKVVLSSAKSGIFAGAILGLGRAFGEATAVSMVAGNKLFGPTFNLLDITRTLTSTMLAGLKETTGLDYDIRYSVGIVLMATILISNLLLNYIKNRIGNKV